MNAAFLRKQIREVLEVFLAEGEQPKFFIKYSEKEWGYVLYKRFFGLDQYDNPNEQIVAVEYLGRNPKQAEIKAKQITGQDLIAQKPKAKPFKRAEMIMPVSTYKGKKLKEIPLGYLVTFVLNSKWMHTIIKDPYLKNIYEYLTKDIASQTQEYLKKEVVGTSTPALSEKYNEYKMYDYSPGIEKMAFANMLMPLMKSELSKRMVQFAEDGTVIIP